MKKIVTDGKLIKLGELGIKCSELQSRMKLGVYASDDEVLDAVQAVIEGREPEVQTLAPVEKFPKWRTFVIGGLAKKALLNRVKTGYKVEKCAVSMIKGLSFETRITEERLDTIILTPKDFGYEERRPTGAEFLDPQRLAEWSQQNANRLPEGYVVDLLPYEVGPHIRDQYRDQPNNETLWVATHWIPSCYGPSLFVVYKASDGDRNLYGDATLTKPMSSVCGHFKFVFCLRKKPESRGF